MIAWADRGLVVRGRINTALYKVLFWVTLVFFCALTASNSLLTLRLSDKYPFNTYWGQICSGRGVNTDNHNPRSRHLLFLAVTLLQSFCLGTKQISNAHIPNNVCVCQEG